MATPWDRTSSTTSLPAFFRTTLAILRKDLLAEWHTKERLSTLVFFVLLTLLVFSFSFEGGAFPLHQIAPGVLWSAFVFASLLGLQHSFAAERENSTVDALRLAPASSSALYLAKALGNLFFLLGVELVSLPFFALFFNLPLHAYLLPLVGVLFLGSVCLCGVGTLFAAVCSNLRLRELLLPLLLLPMIAPALIACVRATGLIFQDSPPEALSPYLRILGVYGVVFFTLSLMLFDYVVEE